MDKISVIVPVYNVEKYIHKCVDSIINQTYENLEIILVDDGSPDNCGKICDEYSKKDNRIRVIHKENGGLSSARNAGLDIATGEYIGFVDSDDYIATDMYEKLYECIQKEKSDMAICNFLYVDESYLPIEHLNIDTSLKNETLKNTEIYYKFLEHKGWYFITAVNRLYKKNIWSVLRFPCGKQHEDEFTAHRIVGVCDTVSCIDDALYYYIQREGSITNVDFSLKNLDAVEAIVDRINYLCYPKYIDMIVKYIFQAISIIERAYKFLDLNAGECKKRIKQLNISLNKIILKLLLKKISIKHKIHFVIFSISPKLYFKSLKKYSDIKSVKGKRYND